MPAAVMHGEAVTDQKADQAEKLQPDPQRCGLISCHRESRDDERRAFMVRRGVTATRTGSSREGWRLSSTSAARTTYSVDIGDDLAQDRLPCAPVGPRTQVDAGANARCPTGLRSRKHIRVFVMARVTAGCTPCQQQLRACRDDRLTDRIADARCAADVLDWRYKAEVLLDRRRDQVWLLRKECQLI